VIGSRGGGRRESGGHKKIEQQKTKWGHGPFKKTGDVNSRFVITTKYGYYTKKYNKKVFKKYTRL
jgi:hypothetical protein